MTYLSIVRSILYTLRSLSQQRRITAIVSYAQCKIKMTPKTDKRTHFRQSKKAGCVCACP